MKIGTSLSRCVRDIYDNRVNINEVMVIISRTNVDVENSKQWSELWNAYAGYSISNSITEWFDYPDNEAEFRKICVDLQKSGKLHQPRQFGAWPQRTEKYWYDVILSPENLESYPAAQTAWNNYKLIAGLMPDSRT